MSATSRSSILDETGRKMSTDKAVEPLAEYVQKHPVCTALTALVIVALHSE